MIQRVVTALLLVGLVSPAFAQGTGPLAIEDRSAPQAQDAAPAQASDEGLMLILQQLQQYEQEIAELRGQLEQVLYEMDQMKQAERERYLDLDTRINALASGANAPAPAGDEQPVASSEAVDPEADRAAYMAAREKLLSSDFAAAGAALERYLADFPKGQFRPYAHFWLGEVYRGQSKPDKPAAMAQFRRVIEDFPDSTKVPSALYKLAVLEAESGDKARAKVTLNKVILQFPEASEAALARSMLDKLGH